MQLTKFYGDNAEKVRSVGAVLAKRAYISGVRPHYVRVFRTYSGSPAAGSFYAAGALSVASFHKSCTVYGFRLRYPRNCESWALRLQSSKMVKRAEVSGTK